MPNNTLFGEASQALSGASQTAGASADRSMVPAEQGVKAGMAASSELGADRRQQMSGEQAQKLQMLKSKLDQAENMITITPQIALGLVKNTGDKEWLQAVGQKMRSDVAIAMYTHGIKAEQAKKATKITQIYQGGKVRHAVVYTDEDGNQQELLLDEGITPETLNKGKGGGKKGGAGSDDDLKKQKVFMASHEKQAALLNDAAKSHQLQQQDPEQYNRIKEEYTKDQDRYDQLKTQLGAAGGSPTPTAKSSPGGEAPFDVDALIKEATSQ